MIATRADIHDQIDALSRLLRGDRPFLLDSRHDADALEPWSLAGCDPEDGFTWRPGDAGDPLELLQAHMNRVKYGPLDRSPCPLAVGYFSYDLGRLTVPSHPLTRWSERDPYGWPVVDFAFYPAFWRRNGTTGQAEIVARDLAAAEKLQKRLAEKPVPIATPGAHALAWELPQARYIHQVERVIDYLHAGDCYQVNFSHRVRARVPESELLGIYARLQKQSPAPLGSFLKTSCGYLLSNSPELFLQRTGNHIETRPIKGTRPRGTTEAADHALAAELAGSAKDRAEHVMIVDLERHDLGQISAPGSVRWHDTLRVVSLPTVHHLVSTVSAELTPAQNLASILRATFPGGSITGAPKLRAMQIVDEVEESLRGPYCGAIGWMDGHKRFTFSLAIRTAIWSEGVLTLPVGGGIVVDSQPLDEWQETMTKAKAFLDVLG